jgi:nicotinate-nucleotide pyrophosphorylase (carboxylating)
LIKENHIRAAGSIGEAIAAAQSRAPHTLRIEIEVTDFDEMEQALQAGADIVMLDNMTPAQVAEAVALANGRAILEASGNVGLHNVREYAEAGVDVISVGALTHSVKAADISLLVK